MFGLGVIDAVIGTMFIFTFVSLVASSAMEGIEGVLEDSRQGSREGDTHRSQ